MEKTSIDPELLRGSLELMVLSTLFNGKKYGYLIQTTLWQTSREAIDLKAGTLYPILHRLEKEGWVKSHWEDDTGRRRKWYEMTASGKKHLRLRVDEWGRYVECLRQVLMPLGELAPHLA
jgi:PadR family transcriptional regulator PadR